jgi:hypothetical protein
VARLYLDDRDRWGLRPLDGITSAPLLHGDGTIRAATGTTRRRGCGASACRPWRCRTASRGDAAAALLRLRRWFRTFAFADAERVRDTGAPVPVVDTAGRPARTRAPSSSRC